MAPQNDPRWLQDGFGIVLIASFCLFRFRFVFGPSLASFWLRFGVLKWARGGKVEFGVSDLLGVQDGAGVVLVRFFFRLAVWGRFLNPIGPLLGLFGGAPGSFWGALGAVRRQNKTVFHLPYFVLECSWSLECSLGAVLGQDETLFRLP